MKKLIIGLILGFVLGVSISAAFAVIQKFETSSTTAYSTVGYGTSDNGTTITRIKVNAAGAVYLQ